MSDLLHPVESQPKTVESHDAFARVFQETKQPMIPSIPKKKSRWKKIAAIAFGVMAVLLVVGGAVGFFGYTKVRALKGRADELKVAGKDAYDAIKSQNLVLAATKMDDLKVKMDAFDSEYKTLAWVTAIPFVNSYYKDGQHGITAGYAGLDAGQTLIKAVEPYADVLGFKGQGSFSGGSAEERIVKIIETLDKVTPSLDAVTKDLDIVSTQLSMIDEKRYPEEFKGMKLRSLIGQAKTYTSGAVQAITQAKPIIQVLPEVAGGKTRKKYLVLFQNSGELRATGGFMTGYAILNVDKGKVEAEASGDIYDLDAKFKNKSPIPAILKKFLTTETKFNLRDMNLSPDFKSSMDLFYQSYQKVPGQPNNIDGIIGVDTHFLESLVKVLGPVEVPGFGTFTAETDPQCGCPQIIYALSEIVDRPTNYIKVNRKGILGPMMKAILAKAYGAPKQIWPDLFGTGWKNVEGKHIQVYFFDKTAQAAAEAVDAAGRIVKTPDATDYITIIDTNLAGAKSNFFIEQEVEHQVELPANGVIKHQVTVMYKNPFKASNCNLEAGQLCLNGKLNDWVRFYLPTGAKLGDARGFDEGSVKESEDLDHHVVEGIFSLQPLSQAKIQFTYTTPYADGKNYAVYLQKQGGTEDIKHKFVVNGEEHDVILNKDQKFVFGF